MRESSSPRTGLSVRRLGLLGAILALALMTALVRSEGPPAPEVPAYGAQPARNPEQLHLLVDPGKVLGWVSGTRDRSREAALVTVAGKKETVPIRRGNTFTWSYRVDRPTPVVIAVGPMRQTVTLLPPTRLPPSVFFVVDRGAYRRGQTLQFAGFLRELDSRGEFIPLPRRTVEVHLASKTRQTFLTLTADEQGRITGRYTFAAADPLGDYRLSIPHYRGAAHVTLAEYQKPKVHLNITSRTEGSRLEVRFQARDHLDRPVVGGKVQFVNWIVREPYVPGPGPLNGKDFAYGGEQPPVLRLEDLRMEERLLARTEDAYEPIVGLSPGCRLPQVIAEIKGRVPLDERGEGVHTIDVKPEWQAPGQAVRVQAFLRVAQGREERRTRTIPLVHNDPILRLTLPRTDFRVNDLIRVTASTTDPSGLKGSGALVAMRLTPGRPMFVGYPAVPFGTFQGQFNPYGMPGAYFGGMQPNFNGFGGFSGFGSFGGMSGSIGWPYPPPVIVSSWESVQRTLAMAIVFRGDTATLRLPEPGAYVLTAIWHRPDGTRWHQEIGCTVQTEPARPALTLHLDRDTWTAGDALTGAVRSRYADARVLLTVRDSVGLRLWQTLRLSRGSAAVNLPLPADLRYGCCVEVQYADSPPSEEAGHVSSRFIHVVPAGRLLTIESRVKPTCEPGEKTVIDLQVNRKEPMDLVVSVSDQSLRDLAPDRSVDVRSFYLADDRVYQGHARDVLRRRLGGLTLAELVKRAQSWLKAHPNGTATSEGAFLQAFVSNPAAQHPTTSDVASLLRLAGVKTRAVGTTHSWQLPAESRPEGVTLRGWLETLETPQQGGWRLHGSFVNDTLFLAAYHPQQCPSPWTATAHRDPFAGKPPPTALPGDDRNQPTLQARRDLSDSAYWNARVRTDAAGKARVEVKLPNALTHWRVVVTAISKDMHVGRHETSFQTAR